jgi:hypothetical protein
MRAKYSFITEIEWSKVHPKQFQKIVSSIYIAK